MKNKLLLILAAFSMTLASCEHGPDVNTPTKIEYKVVMPEDKYFDCPVVALPDPATLTDAEVALLINDLVKTNRLCHNNAAATQEFLLKAKERIESEKVK